MQFACKNIRISILQWRLKTGILKIATPLKRKLLFPWKSFQNSAFSVPLQRRVTWGGLKNNQKSVKKIIADAEGGLGRNPPCWPKGWPSKDLDYEKSDRIFNVLFIGADKLAVIADYKNVYKDQYELLPIDKSILSTNDNFESNALNIVSSCGQFSSVV